MASHAKVSGGASPCRDRYSTCQRGAASHFARHAPCHSRSAVRIRFLAARRRAKGRRTLGETATDRETVDDCRVDRSAVPCALLAHRPAQAAGHRAGATGRDRHDHRPGRPPPAAAARAEPIFPTASSCTTRPANWRWSSSAARRNWLEKQLPIDEDRHRQRQGRLVQRPAPRWCIRTTSCARARRKTCRWSNRSIR